MKSHLYVVDMRNISSEDRKLNLNYLTGNSFLCQKIIEPGKQIQFCVFTWESDDFSINLLPVFCPVKDITGIPYHSVSISYLRSLFSV